MLCQHLQFPQRVSFSSLICMLLFFMTFTCKPQLITIARVLITRIRRSRDTLFSIPDVNRALYFMQQWEKHDYIRSYYLLDNWKIARSIHIMLSLLLTNNKRIHFTVILLSFATRLINSRYRRLKSKVNISSDFLRKNLRRK